MPVRGTRGGNQEREVFCSEFPLPHHIITMCDARTVFQTELRWALFAVPHCSYKQGGCRQADARTRRDLAVVACSFGAPRCTFPWRSDRASESSVGCRPADRSGIRNLGVYSCPLGMSDYNSDGLVETSRRHCGAAERGGGSPVSFLAEPRYAVPGPQHGLRLCPRHGDLKLRLIHVRLR